MEKLFKELTNKAIHIVGVTGSEGSAILRFLIKHGFRQITVHDFSDQESIEANFKLWHKGINGVEKEKLYQQFLLDTAKTRNNYGSNYLKNIEKADLIFVPQSWRLYPQNKPLLSISKIIPLYSLTRLYLDFAKAFIIGITGTVGKGSVSNLLVQLLRKSGKKVYFAGNETWIVQIADQLDEMKEEDYLVLEISHRQLQDGFSRAPRVTVITNIYPNHLDELSYQQYTELKLSLLRQQGSSDICILNDDIPQVRQVTSQIMSKVFYYSEKYQKMNTKNIQNIYQEILDINSVHYPANILAVLTIIDVLHLSVTDAMKYLKQTKALPARLECIKTESGIAVYDDIKSTTPWATLAALKKLGTKTVLICGGKTKGIDYEQFFSYLRDKNCYTVFLESELSKMAQNKLPGTLYQITRDLQEAFMIARNRIQKSGNILVSPAAAFFYSLFIKDKLSLKKLVTSLLPGEKV